MTRTTDGKGSEGVTRRERSTRGRKGEGRGRYAIKAEISDPVASVFEFLHQKTMYRGKEIASGDTIYLFASENEDGTGLVAKGVVLSATPTPKRPDLKRQTPRVSISVRRTAATRRRLGRSELKPHADWHDGRPETELNFKFYRQATNKIVGITGKAAAFLDTHFQPGPAATASR